MNQVHPIWIIFLSILVIIAMIGMIIFGLSIREVSTAIEESSPSSAFRGVWNEDTPYQRGNIVAYHDSEVKYHRHVGVAVRPVREAGWDLGNCYSLAECLNTGFSIELAENQWVETSNVSTSLTFNINPENGLPGNRLMRLRFILKAYGVDGTGTPIDISANLLANYYVRFYLNEYLFQEVLEVPMDDEYETSYFISRLPLKESSTLRIEARRPRDFYGVLRIAHISLETPHWTYICIANQDVEAGHSPLHPQNANEWGCFITAPPTYPTPTPLPTPTLIPTATATPTVAPTPTPTPR